MIVDTPRFIPEGFTPKPAHLRGKGKRTVEREQAFARLMDIRAWTVNELATLLKCSRHCVWALIRPQLRKGRIVVRGVEPRKNRGIKPFLYGRPQ